MKLKLKRGVTAREIAVLHQKLAEAMVAINSVRVEGPLGRSPLAPRSQDALARPFNSLYVALSSLESPLMQASGDDGAPFAMWATPDAWVEWLDAREGGGQ